MTKKKYYLGVDQGTTGTTAMVFDDKWQAMSKGYREHTQFYPKPGWVEHDPIEIWNCIIEAVGSAVKDAGIDINDIAAMGVDNQGETCMAWDKNTGIPIYPAIVWQDRRTARNADLLAEKAGDRIKEKTGMPIDAYFSATKIQWLLENVEGAKRKADKGDLLAGTLDAWMLWKLTHGKVFATDYSTASRTMMMNVHSGQWDDDILNIIGIPKDILPEICDSATVFGHTDPLDFFGASIPISGSMMDQGAALFGQACFTPGSIKTTYGTGCFMLMNVGEKAVFSKNGLLTTVGWGVDGKMACALDGGVYIAGAAVQWLRDKLMIIRESPETEAMAVSVEDTGGLYFVPAFAGLAAPHWDQYARGMMIGLTGGTTREHIARATLESVAFQVNDNLEVMRKDSNIDIPFMRVDGGMVHNKFLMQFQADIMGIPVDVPVVTETTALGVAYMAAYGIGDYKNLGELSSNWQLAHRYEPKMGAEQRERLLRRWRRAVERAKAWEES